MLDRKTIEAEFKMEWAEMLHPDFYTKTMKAVRFGRMPEDEHSIALQLVENEKGLYVPEQINGIYSETEITNKTEFWLENYDSITIVGNTFAFDPYAMGFLKTSPKDLIKRDLYKQALTRKENIFSMVKNEFRRPGKFESIFQDQIDHGAHFEEIMIDNGFKNRDEFIDEAIGNVFKIEVEAIETYKAEMCEKVDERYATLTSEVMDQKLADYYKSDPTKEMSLVQAKIQEIKESHYLIKDMKL